MSTITFSPVGHKILITRDGVSRFLDRDSLSFYRKGDSFVIWKDGFDGTNSRFQESIVVSDVSGISTGDELETLFEEYFNQHSYTAEVGLGRWGSDSVLWNKFGYNNDVDIGTEVLSSWGGTFQFLTVGETLDIVSSSASDDDGSTGVNSVVIYGIDENWDQQTEVVTMNGTTTVTTTSQWIGVNRVAVFLSGSGQTNAGTINITATTSGYQMAQMPTGESVSQQLIFYTPQNHQFLLEWIYFNAIKTSGGGSPEVIFKGWVYSAVNNTKQEIYRGKLDVSNGNELNINPPFPFPLTEKTIFWIEAETDTNNTQISGRFSGILHKD